jgi:hypothetical protein
MTASSLPACCRLLSGSPSLLLLQLLLDSSSIPHRRPVFARVNHPRHHGPHLESEQRLCTLTVGAHIAQREESDLNRRGGGGGGGSISYEFQQRIEGAASFDGGDEGGRVAEQVAKSAGSIGTRPVLLD